MIAPGGRARRAEEHARDWADPLAWQIQHPRLSRGHGRARGHLCGQLRQGLPGDRDHPGQHPQSVGQRRHDGRQSRARTELRDATRVARLPGRDPLAGRGRASEHHRPPIAAERRSGCPDGARAAALHRPLATGGAEARRAGRERLSRSAAERSHQPDSPPAGTDRADHQQAERADHNPAVIAQRHGAPRLRADQCAAGLPAGADLPEARASSQTASPRERARASPRRPRPPPARSSRAARST